MALFSLYEPTDNVNTMRIERAIRISGMFWNIAATINRKLYPVDINAEIAKQIDSKNKDVEDLYVPTAIEDMLHESSHQSALLNRLDYEVKLLKPFLLAPSTRHSPEVKTIAEATYLFNDQTGKSADLMHEFIRHLDKNESSIDQLINTGIERRKLNELVKQYENDTDLSKKMMPRIKTSGAGHKR